MFGSRRRRQREREARLRELEMEARLRELDWLDQTYGMGAVRPAPPPPRQTSRLSGAIALLVVAGVTASAVFAIQPQVFPDRVHELLGTTPERLLPTRGITSGTGEYSFMAMQPDGSEPVGYDPCEVIEIAINPQGAPDDHEELVRTAMQHTSDATGLQFELVEPTDARNFETMDMSDPVLVLWSDESEAPDLSGDIAGVGGSYRVGPLGGGHERYVTGFVVLDREAYQDIRSSNIRQAIVDHEFGHLVGLGHVEDRHQLMNERGGFTTGYGAGDLAVLAELGAIDCR